jgi:hypothetical protein
MRFFYAAIVMLASFIKHVFNEAIEWRSSILDGDLAMKIPSNNRYCFLLAFVVYK